MTPSFFNAASGQPFHSLTNTLPRYCRSATPILVVQNPLAVKLLQGEILPGQTVRVSANGDRMEFKTDAAFATA